MMKINRGLKKIKKSLIKFIIFLVFLLSLIFLCTINNILSKKIDINLNLYEVYLAENEKIKINSSIENLRYVSLDESVAKVDKYGVITGLKSGETIINVKKMYNTVSVKVNVSDLYTVSKLNNEKDYLSCNYYSKEENLYLDKVLDYKINNAGFKTRAGVVEAARFLTLEFLYKIPYFYENGRLLTNGSRSYVDGEGRYYHKGLYLNEIKFDEIVSSQYGPSIWGCDLYTKILGKITPNGMDCSGFVSWALLNAGFDVGDGGAGIDEKKKNDLDDLGEKIKINKNSLKNVKVGDLFSRDGHIGILIGIDNNTFYIAEALDYDLHVLTYDYEEILKSDWTYFINLDNLYKSDGNLTNMW